MTRRGKDARHVGICLLLLGALGCGSGEPQVGEVPASIQHLKKISAAYIDATTRLDRPPANPGELLPFLKKYGDPAAILRSPDDGEEYHILWGVDFRTARGNGGVFPVLAYEQKGKGDKRYVLQIRQVVRLTDEELKQAVFPPGHKPPS
jgi:hypothetical protein